MKSPQRHIRISKYFNRSVVDLGNGLDFYVITPSSILSLANYIFSETHGVRTLNYEVFEKIAFKFDVVHAKSANGSVKTLLAVDLVRDRTEQTVSVSLHGLDSKVSTGQGLVELLFFHQKLGSVLG